MKKAIYSPVTKAIAIALALICVFAAGFELLGVVTDVFNRGNVMLTADDIIYDKLSRSAEELRRLDVLDAETLGAVADNYGLCYEAYEGGVKIGNWENVKTGEYTYSLTCNVEDGRIVSYRLHYEPYTEAVESDQCIYFYATDKTYKEAAKESKALTDALIKRLIPVFAGTIVVFFICVYLSLAAGRKKDGELTSLAIDKMFTEINLFLMLIFAVAIIFVAIVFLDYGAYFNNLGVFALASAGITAASFVIGALALSDIRKLKMHTFLKQSIAYRLFSLAKRLLKKLRKFASETYSALSGKGKAIMAIGIFFLYSVITAFSFISGLLLAIAATGVLAVYTKRAVTDYEALITGIDKIRSGDMTAKIEGVTDEFLLPVAEGINTLGEGIGKAVDEKVKSERMKSELITNVSHDLKTPLTSIINYSDLLVKEELTPAEANDYASIISLKAEKLKKLTQDLFEISKVQSGNDVAVTEKLNLSTLIAQAMAEEESENEKSGLEFIISVPDKINVLCDGKKMSRVFSNLIVNARLYSLSGTRVYIEAEEETDGVLISFKNIASYKMNFKDDEITERFTRGDEARSSDGSGLGLSIAKSFTEACGGSFSVKTDGDLFKATVRLKKA